MISNEKIISKKNAKAIFDRFITRNNDDNTHTNKIISIEGEYGSGKSTVKNELTELLEERYPSNFIYIDYSALQYEQQSQVTSQLYKQIGMKLQSTNKHAFSACAVLKKENFEASYVTGSFGVIALFIFLLTVIVSFLLPYISSNVKLVLSCLLLICCFYSRHQLVRIISGLLPRYTHLEVLENDLDASEFKDKVLILFIDEIDRLSPESVRLLLDEILILNEILSRREIEHNILLFYNPNIVRLLLEACKVPDVNFYLQKYRHSSHKIYKPDFLHMLHRGILESKPSENPSSNRPLSPDHNIFANISDGTPKVPSSNILKCINKHLRSFRDVRQFINYLIEHTYSITVVLGDTRNYEWRGLSYKIDVLVIKLFFDFKYQYSISELHLLDKKDERYKLFIEFSKELDFIYYGPISLNDNAQEDNTPTFNKFAFEFMQSINNIENEFPVNRMYPSTITEDNEHILSIDNENNLEDIFNNGYNSELNMKTIAKYISLNLSEFFLSYQATYPYLSNLKNNKLLVNKDSTSNFLKLIITIEKTISEEIWVNLSTFIYTLDYAKQLYIAAIYAVCYCINKLIPRGYNDSNEAISKIVELINENKQYHSILLYIALNNIIEPGYITGQTPLPRDHVLKILDALELNLPDQIEFTSSLFLFDYFNIISKKSSQPYTYDACLNEDGIFLDATNMTFNMKYSDDCFIHKLKPLLEKTGNLTLYILGATIFDNRNSQALNSNDPIINGVQSIFKKFSMDAFRVKNLDNVKNSDLYKAVESTLNLHKI